jgi:hypothetical protein
MSWSTRFVNPIPLPDGGKLVTFQDASDYIVGLGSAEGLHPEWPAAGKILFATTAEDTDLNRRVEIAIMKAIYGDHGMSVLPSERSPSLTISVAIAAAARS